MDIQIVERNAIPLVGMSFYGDPFREAGDWSTDNEIGHLSRRFIQYAKDNQALLDSIASKDGFYELHIHTPESSAKGFFEVFVGQMMRGNAFTSVPVELSVKILPAGHYAVFNLVGEQIFSDWYRDIETTLKQKGWQRTALYFFQVYDERFKGMERIAESELSAFIPVEPIQS